MKRQLTEWEGISSNHISDESYTQIFETFTTKFKKLNKNKSSK